MRLRNAFILVLATVLAGCFTTGPANIEVEPPPAEFETIEIPLAVHIVTVGLAGGVLQEDQLRQRLPTERVPIIESVSGTTGTPTYQPVRYTFDYTFHGATPEFTNDLFGYALGTGETGRPNPWLVDYDSKGPKRICDGCLPLRADASKDILYLDALETEAWIEAHRADYGLDFGPAAHTIFLLDGENAGVFPTTTYHYWRFDDGMGHSKVPKDAMPPSVEAPMEALGHRAVEAPPFHTPKDPISLRAWGARWNFVWLDLTAAPSNYDFVPRRPAETWTDPPLWDLQGDTLRLHDNLGHDLSDFLQIRVARDPIYPVRTFERFVTPIHVFIEEGALENPQTALGVDMQKWVPQKDIDDSFRLLMPWVETQAPVVFHYLPQDDVGMAETLLNAKRYSDPTLVSAGVVKAYVRDAWDQYVPTAAPSDFVIPQFYFYFNGFYTFWGISTAGGWADGDAWGQPWAIFNHFFDLCVRTNTIPCSKATIGFNNITLLPLHEAGHELGLTHTKDSTNLDEASWPEGHTNWLWDSTYSLMSYRHVYMRFDHYDQMFLGIAHALANLETAHEVLQTVTDEATLASVYEAEDAARLALTEARWADAVAAAREAKDLAAAAAEPAPVTAVAATPAVETTLQTVDLSVPASRTLIGQPNLGFQQVPNPIDLAATGAAEAVHKFTVPDDALWVRIKYWDAVPEYAGTFKQSSVVVTGPDGSYRGGLGEGYEDEVYLTSHWRGTGEHTLHLYQNAGTPGLYRVEIEIARPAQ